MRWLITGVQGFIGSSLADYLVRAGDVVLGVDRKSSPAWDGRGEYLSLDAGMDSLEEVVRRFRPDVVFHAIGTASVRGSFDHPLGDFRGAALTWMNLLEGVRQSEQKPLIFFPSSAAVYGDQGKHLLKESGSPAPISPYGYHKWCCEILAQEYASIYGQRIYLMRLFSLFGVRQRRLLVWEIDRQIRNKEKNVTLYGTGKEFRDYLWIDDFSFGIRELAIQEKRVEAFCERINIARGESILLKDLVDQMIRISGKEKQGIYQGNSSSGDPQCWVADVENLRSRIKVWNPKSLEKSLEICMNEWDQLFRSERTF
jgi:UDP-glucose 4-epimerase